jgi:predicted Fe-Mo cluster-binding NifX family protein
MKIAFTTSGQDLNAPMDPRFGRAAKFLIYDTDRKSFAVIDNSNVDAAQGAGIKAAETIVKAGATVLVTGDCGPKAVNALKMAGVKIYSSKSASVAASLDAYLAEKLSEIISA